MFLVSKQTYTPHQYQWEKIRVVMKSNGKIVQTGEGSAVMGNPVRSVVELVHMLHLTGRCIEPGMIVLTGGITEAIHVKSGDLITLEFDELTTLSLKVSL
ncbi:fumarylacetoacetate hydrolase family protein [Bacillus sp. V33-4]|uniref:fumarylacetoacetate hydrolase family protein n=1 Tax=Bacillus sp. V33-4 TaxID=2054169 RepID=UPI000C761547|nr:fumarylacetoacetate hydrolase family protein [Bacillus sp. V33-4]PLR81244.1 hypothetical protein CVD23_19305 [Bacillus sp. V33-4]